ncbi:hypothetical protein ALP97_200179 [Pseudomonas salomonii]|uniref:Uncharacterized protein n=1 Tax=Pseudomonas salomonii TaxID=191391 RepID=A0A3M4QDI5_9PSED|nr:hypothetical protein ALP97_200179 [Pseudomonas salomonii]
MEKAPQRGQGQEVNRDDQVQLEHAKRRRGHHLRAEQQLLHADHTHQGGVFEHHIELIAQRRHDHSKRLGQHDAPHQLAEPHAQGTPGFVLALVHRADAGADNLGHIRAFVEAQGDDRRLDIAGDDQPEQLDVLEAEDPARCQCGVQKHNLHQQRRTAHQPHIKAYRQVQQRVLRQAQQRRRQAQRTAEQHRQHADQARQPQPGEVDPTGLQQVLPEHIPIEIHRDRTSVK